MPKSAFTEAHQQLVELLASERQKAGLDQREVARRLGKNQSFVSRIESGQRRVDVLEFYALARALGADPAELYGRLVEQLPEELSI